MATIIDDQLLQRVEEKSAELAWALRNDAIDAQMREKLAALCVDLLDKERVAVAFSAGVDSTLLLAVAHRLLDKACVAITAQSKLMPKTEFDQAAVFCKEQDIRHVVSPFNEMQVEQMASNPADRCYWCKRSLMGKMKQIAALVGCPCLIDGSNADDELDYRPGARALQELEIASPLKEAGFTKADVRELSRVLKLGTCDVPSHACLASRIPYGQAITEEKLALIEGAEALLAARGFANVRVRVHEAPDDQTLIARVEVPSEEVPRFSALEVAREVDAEMREMGFSYVTLDLGGYETGKLNKEIGR